MDTSCKDLGSQFLHVIVVYGIIDGIPVVQIHVLQMLLHGSLALCFISCRASCSSGRFLILSPYEHLAL